MIVSKQITYICNSQISKNLELVYKHIYKIHNNVKHFDSHINVYNIISFFVYLILCISSVCHLAKDPNVRFWFKSFSFVICIHKLLFHCIVCNLIPKSFEKLLNTLEMNRLLRPYRESDSLWMIQLFNLKQEIGFTALGLFHINTNTFISSLGLITTYSVIIIQT